MKDELMPPLPKPLCIDDHMARYSVKQMREYAKKAVEAAFREGFYAGFSESGEGWNAEYPFDYRDIRGDEGLEALLSDALKARR